MSQQILHNARPGHLSGPRRVVCSEQRFQSIVFRPKYEAKTCSNPRLVKKIEKKESHPVSWLAFHRIGDKLVDGTDFPAMPEAGFMLISFSGRGACAGKSGKVSVFNKKIEKNLFFRYNFPFLRV